METNHWEKTNDIVGLKESKPIYCPICLARALADNTPLSETPKLVMRRSRIHQVADVRLAAYRKEQDIRPYAFDLAYKCPECDFYCIFGIPTEIDYAQGIIKIREGKPEYVLPEETWLGQQVVSNRLSRWGYW